MLYRKNVMQTIMVWVKQLSDICKSGLTSRVSVLQSIKSTFCVSVHVHVLIAISPVFPHLD